MVAGGIRHAVQAAGEYRYHAALPGYAGRPGGDGHRERPAHLGGGGSGGAAACPGIERVTYLNMEGGATDMAFSSVEGCAAAGQVPLWQAVREDDLRERGWPLRPVLGHMADALVGHEGPSGAVRSRRPLHQRAGGGARAGRDPRDRQPLALPAAGDRRRPQNGGSATPA